MLPGNARTHQRDVNGYVWRECARVLKSSGLLAFTFHQSKIEGWTELVKALKVAGFVITSVQPVKAEMSTAAPKSGASTPSNLDSVVSCRLISTTGAPELNLLASEGLAIHRLGVTKDAGIAVGVADVVSVVRGSILAAWTHPSCQLDLVQLAVLAEAAVARALVVLEVEPKATAC